MIKKKKTKTRIRIIVGATILSLSAIFYFWLLTPGANFQVSPSPSTAVFKSSPISGLSCANADRRPVAVMLSGDAVARPLSGLSEADLVFNLPVFTENITRLMAVFVCGSPKEIGSVRSARHDFIYLDQGLDALYAHWGGSRFALDLLSQGVIDNFDALPNRFNAFWRKSDMAAPHNGFTSMDRLMNAGEKSGYRLTDEFVGYPHLAADEIKPIIGSQRSLDIDFAGGPTIKYVFDPVSDSYGQWRDGTKEIDKNNNQPVVAKDIVVLRAPSKQIEDQYNDVQIEGEGKATFYLNGEEIAGLWKKDAGAKQNKLYFYDLAGQEIKFVPGQIWVEVVDPGQSVIWH